jgi:hypothetical protein
LHTYIVSVQNLSLQQLEAVTKGITKEGFKEHWKRVERTSGKKIILCHKNVKRKYDPLCLWGNIQNSFPGTLFFLIFNREKVFFTLQSSLNFTLPLVVLLLFVIISISSFFFLPHIAFSWSHSGSLKASAFFRNCILLPSLSLFLFFCSAFMLKRAPQCWC